ncbi:MAG TPA: hypothetical protein VF115_02520 [Acidimicrobiia bacterium]
MREHELELIAALAEGRLEDESEARAIIASSAEARAEFDAQKKAIEALADVGTASMSDTERSALRRDVWTELRAPEPAVGSGKPWYYRWMPVAAGMLVIIGLVAVVSQGGGLGGIVTADEAASETTLADTETTQAMAEELDGGDEAADGAPITEEPTDGEGESGEDGDLGQAVPPAAAAFYAAVADDIRSGEETEPQTRALETPSPSELAECLAEAGLEGYEVQDVNPAPDEGDREVPDAAVPYVAAIPVDADRTTTEVAFVGLETCELIHIDR